jgi:hypothetical protein
MYNDMRTRTYVASVLLAVLMLGGFCACQDSWKTVSSFRYDWNHRGRLVKFTFDDHSEDPGDFKRVRIQVPGRKEVVITNKTGWVKWRSESDWLRPDTLSAREDAKSDYALFLPVSPGRSLLVLIGYGYASSPGSLHVLELTETDEPRLVLYKEELGLDHLVDLDGDGIKELVGYPCLSQVWGHDFLTYDPLHVYKLPPKPGIGNALLSLDLSKKYNLKHYYGWAGPDCSEDIAVVQHPPGGGKPVIMKANEAEKLFEGKK